LLGPKLYLPYRELQALAALKLFLTSVVRENCTLRSVGAGGDCPWRPGPRGNITRGLLGPGDSSDNCKVAYGPAKQLLHEFFDERPRSLVFYKGEGCPSCNLTGYRAYDRAAGIMARGVLGLR
jgi:hypothetical protein